MENNQKTKELKTFSSFLVGVGEEKSYLLENLSLLLASGVGISTALDSIKDGLRSRAMKQRLEVVQQLVSQGKPLSSALAHVALFKEHVISLVKIGEETGRLPDNLKVIAMEEAKDRDFRSKIKSAMMYPVFVLVLTFIVGTGIGWFILPKLTLVFNDLHVKLPLITKLLLSTGNFLGTYGVIFVPCFFVFIFLTIYILFIYRKTKHIGQSILFQIPGIGRLLKEVEIARFGYILGSLLDAGVPIVQAIDSLSKATSYSRHRKFYEAFKESVSVGNSIKKSFQNYPKLYKIIPGPIQQLVVSAEFSGTLSKTLLKIGETYTLKTDTTTKNISTIIEPILLVIVWLGVVGVALAVILPIYSLIGGLQV